MLPWIKVHIMCLQLLLALPLSRTLLVESGCDAIKY